LLTFLGSLAKFADEHHRAAYQHRPPDETPERFQKGTSLSIAQFRLLVEAARFLEKAGCYV
jgi:hypothetical protein